MHKNTFDTSMLRIALDTSLHKKLKRMAFECDLSMTQVISILIDHHDQDTIKCILSIDDYVVTSQQAEPEEAAAESSNISIEPEPIVSAEEAERVRLSTIDKLFANLEEVETPVDETAPDELLEIVTPQQPKSPATKPSLASQNLPSKQDGGDIPSHAEGHSYSLAELELFGTALDTFGQSEIRQLCKEDPTFAEKLRQLEEHENK